MARTTSTKGPRPRPATPPVGNILPPAPRTVIPPVPTVQRQTYPAGAPVTAGRRRPVTTRRGGR